MKKKANVPGLTRKSASKTREDSFPIVGLGASAGGLEAFGTFFANMPPDTGMAFVLVQHLDPTHTSSMVNLLQRYTKMPVLEAANSLRIAPNRGMTISKGTLQLIEQREHPGIAHSIDTFFLSLAEQLQERAIGIILSGTGSDGTQGARAIKAELGLVIAQDPQTARYDGMPRAVIAAGVADLVLPADKMAEKLIDYVAYRNGRRAADRSGERDSDTSDLQKIFNLIRARTRQDFSTYKHSTLKRRIERRLAVNQIDNIDEYLRLLKKIPGELEDLVKDFLINVTSFFRDPEAFESLAVHLAEKISAWNVNDSRPFRIWVIGCSTGEEAYSLAILLHELMEREQRYLDWQIFATDLDPDAIDTARKGRYPETIRTDVSPERLKKYFTLKDGWYLVSRDIREKVIFSLHDITNEPPLSRMDLISTRNLLIYLNGEMQRKLIPLFHYSLNEGGLLFLGTAETVGEFNDKFSWLDRKWRIYRVEKKGLHLPVQIPGAIRNRSVARPLTMTASSTAAEIREVEKDLLQALPPSVLVEETGQILYVHGDTWKYLQLAEGKPSSSIMEMAREGIEATLAAVMNEVLDKGIAVTRESARSRINGHTIKVKITVKPVKMPFAGPRRLVVTFEDMALPQRRSKKSDESEAGERIRELEQELQFTRESLRSTVEELETANEELRSANEEYQSTNEELQSTNEELETSREELQSVNEELVTVNTEHQRKIEDLSTINDDMQNLLNSTEIATVFLDKELNIKRYTPTATKILNFIDVDVGRPLSHITSNLKADNLTEAAKRVLDKLIPVIQEVEARDGRWYTLRIHPYRTTTNVIAGVVLSFVDINDQKLLEQEMNAIFDMLPDGVLVLDSGLRVLSANQYFYEAFHRTAPETVGRHIREIIRKLDSAPLGEPGEEGIRELVIEETFPSFGPKRLRINSHILHGLRGTSRKILMVIKDVTQEKNGEVPA